jgi:pyruvate dehydrogenase E2 component (dihydrolipoamide acetyltransferase)
MHVLMPQLGETVTEGTISAWHKSVGDVIKPGDSLFDVETDKASMDVPATSSGVLTEIRVVVGDIAPVGAVVAVITGEGEAAESPEAPSKPARAAAPPAAATATSSPAVMSRAPTPTAPRPARRMTPGSEVVSPERNFGPARLANGTIATPYARRLAVEQSIRLSDVRGSGADGRVNGKDVLAHSRGAGAGSGPSTNAAIKAQYDASHYIARPVDGMRAAIARRLTESVQTVPQFHLTIDIDTTALAIVRESLKTVAKVSMTDLILSVWAAALQTVPQANAVWAGDHILQFAEVDLGVAIAIEGGLVTPVIRNASGKSPQEIGLALKDLAARARTRKLKQDELRGGVSSVSNLGMFGVRQFTAIINPPQSTILAVGATQRRPIEGRDGKLTFIPVTTVTLGCDHRVIDGALGAKLLSVFRELAENIR